MKNTLQTALKTYALDSRKLMAILLEIAANELTEVQQDTFLAYYLRGKSIPEIAAEKNVNKSTVSRNLQKAEAKLLRYTRYLEMVNH